MRRPRYPRRAGRLRPAPARLAARLLAGTLVLAGLAGCDDGTPADPPETADPAAPSLQESQLPPFWVLDSPVFHTVQVQLELEPEVADAVLAGDLPRPRARLLLLGSAGSEPLIVPLFDDGGAVVQTGLAAWQDSLSGDLVPGDFRYSARINALFADGPGAYPVQLQAGWEDSLQPLETTLDTLQVEPNSPPEILGFSVPDSLPAGFGPQVWSASLREPDTFDGDEVSGVSFELRDSTDTVIRERVLSRQSDTLWTFSTDSTFSAGLATGSYRFRLVARDLFQQSSDPFVREVWCENTAPLPMNLSAPDTVVEPVEGINYYLFTLVVQDRQGTQDIENVGFQVLRPDSILVTNEEFFVFFNDGSNGDETAGDSLWTHLLPLQRSENPDRPTLFNDPYTFQFFAEDRAGNRSDLLEHEIVIVPEEGGSP